MADENGYIGKKIGNYRLLEKLACGTFGCVYRGEHTILSNRIVAIKLMHSIYLDSQKERDSFIREAQLLEKLKHPYILPIIDIGFQEGFPYMVTEYALNGSLRDRLQRHSQQPLAEKEAITILIQVGQALHHAHQQNIVHRDLKPENILFNAKGEALLADFGIATMLNTLSIQLGTFIGTPSYMSPEQFENRICKESDQYALGCIAYELVTGHKPFTGNIFALANQHINNPPIPPTQFNSHLPIQIEQAILKAMAKQYTDRHRDIFAFIAALQKSSNQWLDEGNTLRDLGRFKEALVAYDQAIRLDPDNMSAYDNKAEVLKNLKQYETELVTYEQNIRLDPNDQIAYYNKAEVLKDLERYEESLAVYEHLISFDPYDVSPYIRKGVILRNLDRHEEALVVYEQIIFISPDYLFAYYNKAEALKNLKRYEEALIAYDHVISLDPNNINAYNGKGTVLEQLGRLKEAQKLYKKLHGLVISL